MVIMQTLATQSEDAFVQFSKVSLSFGEHDILNDVSLNLKTGDKVALAGVNGSGKSTLMKIMAGKILADSGQCVAKKGARIAYLPQAGLSYAGLSLLQEVDKAFSYAHDIKASLDSVAQKLANNEGDTQSLTAQYGELATMLEEAEYETRGERAKQVLCGLGFSERDFDKHCETFSLGWQMRIALAKVLLSQSAILLLDEPTNYLDLEAREWLEGFLKGFSGAFLIVSHDRYFLDVTVNAVYELFNGKLKRYAGNYSNYEKLRQEEIAALVKAYDKQQQEIVHLQEFIDRFRYKATKAAQAQERQKQLDKIVPIVIPETLKQLHFTFPMAPHSGKVALVLDNVSKTYDKERYIIKDLSLTLKAKEHLVVTGVNGAGKTTLLKIIAKADTNFEGKVSLGSGVSVGYFSQDSTQKISGETSVLDYIESIAPLELVPKLRDMLGAFLFRGDSVFKSLDMLSGGEKARIALLELLLRPVNLLVLDEPTNHLDLQSKDALLCALKDFGGTVIFVSHDRDFIQSLATVVLHLDNGKHSLYPGDYEYYLEQKAKLAIVNTTAASCTIKTKLSPTKLSWQEGKERNTNIKRVKKLEEQVIKDLQEEEEIKKQLETSLSLPEVYSNGLKAQSVQQKIKEQEHKITALENKWQEVAIQLEALHNGA